MVNKLLSDRLTEFDHCTFHCLWLRIPLYHCTNWLSLPLTIRHGFYGKWKDARNSKCICFLGFLVLLLRNLVVLLTMSVTSSLSSTWTNLLRLLSTLSLKSWSGPHKKMIESYVHSEHLCLLWGSWTVPALFDLQDVEDLRKHWGMNRWKDFGQNPATCWYWCFFLIAFWRLWQNIWWTNIATAHF